jgi:hypothetical protein
MKTLDNLGNLWQLTCPCSQSETSHSPLCEASRWVVVIPAMFKSLWRHELSRLNCVVILLSRSRQMLELVPHLCHDDFLPFLILTLSWNNPQKTIRNLEDKKGLIACRGIMKTRCTVAALTKTFRQVESLLTCECPVLVKQHIRMTVYISLCPHGK